MDLDILDLALRLPVVLFALTIHEFMHGYVAWKCGDDTALRAGRLTLNPLAHLDLLGTICLIFAPIGWAKPVPVNPYNYHNPRRDDILVSGAGVAANFTIAAAVAILVRVLLEQGIVPTTRLEGLVWIVMRYAIILNFGLFVFNLLPIAPLDGSHILRELLPAQAAARFAELGRYGLFFLIGVVVANRYIQFDFLGYHGVTPLMAPILALMYVFAGPYGTSILI